MPKLSAVKAEIADDKDFVKTCLQDAKDAAARSSPDQAEDELELAEERLEEMLDNEDYLKADPTLPAYATEQRRLMKAVLAGSKEANVKEELAEDKDFVKRRMKDAKDATPRLPDVVLDNHKQVEKRLTAMLKKDAYKKIDSGLAKYAEETRKVIKAAAVQLKSAGAKDDLAEDKDFVKRRMQDAKDAGTRFPERVEENHKEAERRLAAMLKKDAYHQVDPALPKYAEDVRGAMKLLKLQLNSAGAKDDLDEDKDYVKRRMQDAKDAGTRFPERVEENHKDADKRITSMLKKSIYLEIEAGLPEWAAHRRQEMKAFYKGVMSELVLEDLQDEFDKVKSCIKSAQEDTPRFLDRAEEALEVLDDLWNEEKYFGIDAAEDFLAQHRPMVQEKLKETRNLIMADDIDTAIHDPKDAMKSAFSELKQHGIWEERALDLHNDAMEQGLQLEDEHPEWAECPIFVAFKAEMKRSSSKFSAAWATAVAEKAAEDKIDGVWETLTCAETYREGSFDRAMEYLHEARDEAEEMGRDPQLARVRSVFTFLSEKFWPKWNATSESMQDELYRERVERMIDDFMQPMSHAESYFTAGNEEQALQYYDEAKGLLQELFDQPDPVLLARPEIPPAVTKFNEMAAAFDKLFHDTVTARERADIFDTIGTDMEHAHTYFDSHSESIAMQHFDDAKAASVDARIKYLCPGPAAPGEEPKVDEEAVAFFAKFDRDAARFQKNFLARRAEEKKDDLLGDAKDHSEWAVSYFDANPEIAAGHRQDAARDIAAIEADDALNKQPDVIAAVAAAKATLAKYDTMFVERVVTAKFEDKSGSALITLDEAEGQLTQDNTTRCGELLVEARTLAAEVMANREIAKVLEGDATPLRAKIQADVDGFRKEFTGKAKKIDTDCRNAIVDAQFKDKTEDCSNALMYAQTDGKSELYDSAMKHYDDAIDAREELASDGLLLGAREAAVKDFLADFDKKAAAFRADIVAKVLAEELETQISTMEDTLTFAHEYFASHSDDQALSYLAEAKGYAAELALDRRFDGMRPLEDAMDRFRAGVEDFNKKFSARRKAEKVEDARSNATDNIAFAEEYFKSGQRDRALDYAGEARDAADAHKMDPELMAEPGADAWQADVEQRLEAFEKRFNEEVFAEEVASLQQDCEQPLSEVQHDIAAGNLPGAACNVAAAREAATLLGSEPKFARNAAVDKFLGRFSKDCDRAAKKVALAVAREARTKQEESLTDLHSHAVTYFECGRQDQGLDYLAQARDGIEELQDVVASMAAFPAEQEKAEAFITKFEEELGETSDKFQRTLLLEEAQKLIVAADDGLATAGFHVQAGEPSRGLDALESAKEQAAALGDSRYFRLPEAVAFFETWPSRVEAFVRKVEKVLYAEAIRTATEGVKDAVRTAESLAELEQFDKALEEAQEAATLLEDLGHNPDIGSSDTIVAFRKQQTAAVAALKQRITVALFKDEVQEVCRSATSDVTTAEALLRSYAMEQALEKQVEAKEAVAALKTDERYRDAAEAKKTAAALEPRLVAFETAFVQSQLQDEANACLTAFQKNAAEFERLERRGILQSEAGIALAATIGSSVADAEAGIHHGMLLRCPKVPEAVAAAKALRVQFAREAVGSAAKRACDVAQRGLDGDVKTHLTRGFHTLAVEAFAATVAAPFARVIAGQNTAAPGAPVPAGPTAEQKAELAMLVPETAAFVEATAEFCATSLQGRVTFTPFGEADEAGSGKKRKGGAAGSGCSIAAAFGESIGEEFKMASLAMSADVNPKIFGAVKLFNTAVGRVNRNVRTMVKELKNLGWDTPLSAKSFNAKTGKLPFELTNREFVWAIEDMPETKKEVQRAIAEAKEDAPQDPLTLKMIEDFDEFLAAFAAARKRWDGMRAIAENLKRLVLSVGGLKEILAAAAATRTCCTHPQVVECTEASSRKHDYDAFVSVADKADRAHASIEKHSIEGRFPMKAELLEQFTELKQEALRIHPLHCCNVFIRSETCWWESTPMLYLRALQRFPKARAMAGELIRERQAAFFRHRSLADITEFEKRTGSKLAFKDPFTGPQPDEFEEAEEALIKAFYLRPATAFSAAAAKPYTTAFSDTAAAEAADLASLPMGKRQPKSKSPLAGKIVFGEAALPANVTAGSSDLSTDFDANDTIHMRAFWPHALCDYPLGVDRDGKPLYGPAALAKTHKLYLTLDCFIDGKRVEAPGSRTTATISTHFHDTDFYASATTCRNVMGGTFIASPEDQWESVGNRLRRAYKSLSKGKHTVRVDLRFRLAPDEDNLRFFGTDEAVFPMQDTPLSAPIATGSFTVSVPSSPAAVKLATIFAPRPSALRLSRPVATEVEEAIAKLLRNSVQWGKRQKRPEQLIHVTVTSDWYVSGWDWFEAASGKVVKEAVEYSVSCTAYFYRSPAAGWGAEEIAVFNLSPSTVCERGPKKQPPFVDLGVGDDECFDPELLPDDSLALIKDRCPTAKRQPTVTTYVDPTAM